MNDYYPRTLNTHAAASKPNNIQLECALRHTIRCIWPTGIYNNYNSCTSSADIVVVVHV